MLPSLVYKDFSSRKRMNKSRACWYQVTVLGLFPSDLLKASNCLLSFSRVTSLLSISLQRLGLLDMMKPSFTQVKVLWLALDYYWRQCGVLVAKSGALLPSWGGVLARAWLSEEGSQ